MPNVGITSDDEGEASRVLNMPGRDNEVNNSLGALVATLHVGRNRNRRTTNC